MIDAIKQLLSFKKSYPQIIKFEIIDYNHIVIHLTDTTENTFSGDIMAIIEWCEENLEETN